MHRRKVAVVIGLVLGVVVFGLWWGLHRTGQPSVESVAVPQPERAPSPAPAPGPRSAVEGPPAPPAPPPALTAVAPPIID
ncbi:MAG TPA: hypothetical protein VKO16_11775, partial [Polyangia bacterium]|nr:hypothetical protein [Polyangia bacterium]